MIDFIAIVVAVILGTVLFNLLNKTFKISYFAVKGMVVTWFACALVSFFVLVMLLDKIGIV